MKPIYTSRQDLILNKQGSVNLNSLHPNQKRSYREAIESIIAFGDFKSLEGKTTLCDLTPADRVFYGQHQDFTPVTTQIRLPFAGVYTDQPYQIMWRALSDKAETITDEQHDNLWCVFHTEFDHKKYRQKVAELYAHWLMHSLYGVSANDVELHCPLEQLDLTLDYFKCNPIDNELYIQFIDYMWAQGHYDALFRDCLPKDFTDYLSDTP